MCFVIPQPKLEQTAKKYLLDARVVRNMLTIFTIMLNLYANKMLLLYGAFKGTYGFPPFFEYLRLASYRLATCDLRLATCDLRLATCDLRLAF